MSLHALEVLEFERVLERVAARASSAAGRERVLGCRPSRDAGDVARELGRVASTMRFIGDAPEWAPAAVPDAASDIAQLDVDGAVLEPLALHRLGVLLAASRLLAAELARRGDRHPELLTVRDALLTRKELEDAVTRTVDGEGQVLGSASKDLKRIRDQLRGAHATIVRRLEGYLATLAERFVVPDGSVTVREGRYVIPVRREGRREVGGIVHDESQTGATLYVEPPIAIELMNRLRELEREEAREVRRVLAALTAEIAPEGPALAGALDALADFDSLLARAKTATAWGAVPPEVVTAEPTALRIHEGRHPLLLETIGAAVVSFDLELGGSERCMVVSGPNTGGKSVFLKATGLIAALGQSGIVPPVGAGTRLPVFGSFYADIGDEQSIARNLSTFSAHLANLAEVLRTADRRSLVLIDEMGTGTDPAEGAALARAVLEDLVARGAMTLASSHLGDLKRLDREGSGIVNASLLFDADRMEPTYRLVKGRPGGSYGLLIARRLGFPGPVLDRAVGYAGEGSSGLEDLLARLERQERNAEALLAELEMERARTEALRGDVENREARLDEAESTAKRRAREDARTLLMEARAEVDAAIRELQGAAAEGASLEAAAREARGRVERAARRAREDVAAVAGGRPEPVLEPGAEVRIRATGARGRLVERRADRGVVEVGALRLEMPLHELDPTVDAGGAAARRPASAGWTGPVRGPVRTEVDLRGLRVDEVDLELGKALDAAILDELPQLRVIHGKGTGALRQRVGELLGQDRRVRAFRMGGPTEGGAGVTVAVLGGSP